MNDLEREKKREFFFPLKLYLQRLAILGVSSSRKNCFRRSLKIFENMRESILSSFVSIFHRHRPLESFLGRGESGGGVLFR